MDTETQDTRDKELQGYTATELIQRMLKLEQEVKSVIEKNTILVQKVQHWKMKSAKMEQNQLDLIKENNELRLQLSRLRSGGAAQARALDSALQEGVEEAMTLLVQASGSVANLLSIAKSHYAQRQELEAALPRWSTLGSTPVREKVHKVPPMMMGGRSIQPFVSLNRVPLSSNRNSEPSRSPSRNVSERDLPLPMNMLQDLYIPLRRIDTSMFAHNQGRLEQVADHEGDDDDLPAEDGATEPALEDSRRTIPDDDVEMSQLAVVHEQTEEDVDETRSTSPTLYTIENPLEGPSWLLDNIERRCTTESRRVGRGEADSTTEPDESLPRTPPPPHPPAASSPAAAAAGEPSPPQIENIPPPGSVEAGEGRVFTPTVRRRKHATPTPAPHRRPAAPALSPAQHFRPAPSPHLRPAPSPHLRPTAPSPHLRPTAPSPHLRPTVPSPHLRPAAPAPNDSAPARSPILQCTRTRKHRSREARGDNASAGGSARERGSSSTGSDTGDNESERDSDGGAGGKRARRARNPVTYKEIPLNRKLRR